MEKKPSRVFAVCQPVHKEPGSGRLLPAADLTPAQEYGQLVVLLPSNSALLSMVPTVRALREKLADFSDNDYILPVGDPVLIAAVAAVASDINHGKVNYLKWDKKFKRYYNTTVDAYGRAL